MTLQSRKICTNVFLTTYQVSFWLSHGEAAKFARLKTQPFGRSLLCPFFVSGTEQKAVLTHKFLQQDMSLPEGAQLDGRKEVMTI